MLEGQSKNLKGKLTISRVRSNQSEGFVMIQLQDEISGVVACKIEMPVESFGEAFFTGHQPCEFTVHDGGNVGKRRELREILVPIPPVDIESRRPGVDGYTGLRWIEKHAKGELVDGWRPHSPGQVFNSHQHRGKQVRVSLIRFVDVGTEPAGEE